MNRGDLVFLDTETTGGLPEDRLCQVAYIYQDKEHEELFKPPLTIKPDASAVNHIDNHMVADKDPFEDSQMQKDLKKLLEKEEKILVAHNARFDIDMIAKDGVETKQFIDTLKVARAMDPEGAIPKYGMQFLRYYLDLRVEGAQAHDALGDVLVLRALFDRLFEKKKVELGDDKSVIEWMLEVSQLPSMIKTFSFGKYRGQKIADVAKTDKGYLEWLLKQKEIQAAEGSRDEDWLYTLKTLLDK